MSLLLAFVLGIICGPVIFFLMLWMTFGIIYLVSYDRLP